MSAASTPQTKTGLTDRLLNKVEWLGNKLPEPFMLFLILFAITGVVSTAMALDGRHRRRARRGRAHGHQGPVHR